MFEGNNLNNGNVMTQDRVGDGATTADNFLKMQDTKVEDAEPASPAFGLLVESPSAQKEQKDANQSPSAHELSPTRDSE